jgi:hypothetical protein
LTISHVSIHYQHTHRKNYDSLDKQRKEEEVILLIVALSNASAYPRAMMIHLLNANPAEIAMTGPGRAVDVTGKAKFDFVYLHHIRDDVGNVIVALENVFVFGDRQEVTFRFVFFRLNSKNSYYFLNDARLRSDDVDVGVEVQKLEDNQQSY